MKLGKPLDCQMIDRDLKNRSSGYSLAYLLWSDISKKVYFDLREVMWGTIGESLNVTIDEIR